MTPRHFIGPAVVVVLSVMLAGCVPAGDVATVTYAGSMNASNSTFEIDGYLSVGGGIAERDVYHNVTVSLYKEDGTEISTTELGDLFVDSELEVSITSDEVPYYIVFKSPDFWGEDTSFPYYVFDEDDHYQDVDYKQEGVLSKEDLPV